jgi:hypothetical protein
MRNHLHTPLPGQFRLLSLFVITTLAAIGAAIVRLPLPALAKIACLLALWFSFQFAILATIKRPFSPTDRVNLAALDIVGQILMLALFGWTSIMRSRAPSSVDFLFFGLLALGPVLAIVRASKTIRQVLSPKVGDQAVSDR